MRPGARVQHRVLRSEALHVSGHQKSREVGERPSSAGARGPLKPLAGSGPKQRPCPSDVCAEPGCPGRRPESPARNGRNPPASPDPLGRPLAGAASEGGGHCGGRLFVPPRPAPEGRPAAPGGRGGRPRGPRDALRVRPGRAELVRLASASQRGGAEGGRAGAPGPTHSPGPPDAPRGAPAFPPARAAGPYHGLPGLPAGSSRAPASFHHGCPQRWSLQRVGDRAHLPILQQLRAARGGRA